VKGLVEDAEDAAADAEAAAHAIAAGATPLRAWRDHSGLALQALADAAGLSKPHLSQIERGKRAGTAATWENLSGVPDLPLAAVLS